MKKNKPQDLVIRLAIAAILIGLLLVAAGATSAHAAPAPSPATSAPAAEQFGAKNCTITKWMPQGTGLVIALASTGEILYRISNQYPNLIVNGATYDGRYHRFAIGSGISIIRPYFSTGFSVTVSCPTYGISNAE
jgi:hypothetical protein